MEGDITKESDEGRWNALLNLWRQEHKPGWVVTGKSTYQVIKIDDTNIIFRPTKGGQELYEHTSF